MEKLDLKKIEYWAIWAWRLLMVILVSGVLSYQVNLSKYLEFTHTDLKARVENVFTVVKSKNNQPEIPDAESNEYQVSCPTESDFLDDPDKVIAFLNALDPYVTNDPWKLQFLSVLLLADRDAARDYLELQFSNGYPYK